MSWLQFLFAIYVIAVLLFVNGVLLLCNDDRHCLFPINTSSLQYHLAFRLRSFYSSTSMDMGRLFLIANLTLGF